jgi:WD40 repeat protein
MTLAGHEDWVNDVAISPDNAQLLTGSSDGKAILWDLDTGQEKMSFDHGDAIWCVSFSPDGRFIATGGGGAGFADTTGKGAAIIWDIESGQQLLVLKGHDQFLKEAIFSPDGTRLLTTSWDATARLWDARTGKEQFTFTGHTGPVFGADFCPEGNLLATAAADGRIKIWDVQTGVLLLTLTGHTGVISGLEFSPDCTRLASSADDGTVREYVISLEALIELAYQRLTRTLTDEECRQFLHRDQCPDGE